MKIFVLDIQMLLTPNTSKFCFILVIFFLRKRKKIQGVNLNALRIFKTLIARPSVRKREIECVLSTCKHKPLPAAGQIVL